MHDQPGAADAEAGRDGGGERSPRARRPAARSSAPGYDAFLVGERLIAQPDPGARAAAFGRSAGVIRVKICGVTTPDDADARGGAAGRRRSGWSSGRAARGSSRWRRRRRSSRRCRRSSARSASSSISPSTLAHVAREVGLAAVQFHGDEIPGDLPRVPVSRDQGGHRARRVGAIEAAAACRRRHRPARRARSGEDAAAPGGSSTGRSPR